MPRKSRQDDPVDVINFHGFSNASLQNYVACLYLRSVSKSENVSVNLVAARSRLAPLKPATIPRFELLGNSVLTRLMNFVENALDEAIYISKSYFWNDSQVPSFVG